MNKILRYFILVLILIISISCDEEFNLKGPLDDEYVFNCVLRGDTTTQYATITRSYDVANYNPVSNPVNPVVKGAKIKLISNGKVYTMRDTVLPLTDPQYKTPVSCYYVNNLQLDIAQTINAQVIMPDGKVLTATTKTVPTNDLKLQFEGSIPQKDTFGNYLDHVTLSWLFPSYIKDPYSADIYYAPQLSIEYYKKENGNSIFMKKIIPDEYRVINDKLVPHYPDAGHTGLFTFDLNAITRALNEISEGDDNKSNYIITRVVLTILMFDESLALYYSANQTFDNGLTLTLLPPDFSNVSGGKGIFGSYMKIETSLLFRSFYIEPFGYQYTYSY